MRSARSGEFDAERGKVPLLAYREKAEAPLPILAAGLFSKLTTDIPQLQGLQQGLGRNDVGCRAVRKAVLLEPHLGMMDAVGKALLPGAAASRKQREGTRSVTSAKSSEPHMGSWLSTALPPSSL